MSTLDKLDASLLDLIRLIYKTSPGENTALKDQADLVGRDLRLLRAELATPVLPESYDDLAEKTLRDEFAMHVLPVLISGADWSNPMYSVEQITKWAYGYADAMLAARAAPP